MRLEAFTIAVINSECPQSLSRVGSGAQEVKAFPFLAAVTGWLGINIEAGAALPATYTESKDKDFTELSTMFH